MRLIHVVALAALAVVVPVGNPGCSKYGEGSICDPDNTDPETGISDDCEDGLLCTTGLCADARGICCPPPGHNITSPACEGMCNGTGGSSAGGGQSTSVGGFGGAGGGTGGTGGMPNLCPHDECHTGAPLDPSCTQCVSDICAKDITCCVHEWDSICVGEIKPVCGVGLQKLYNSGVCKHEGTGGGSGTGGKAGTGGGGVGGSGGAAGAGGA